MAAAHVGGAGGDLTAVAADDLLCLPAKPQSHVVPYEAETTQGTASGKGNEHVAAATWAGTGATAQGKPRPLMASPLQDAVLPDVMLYNAGMLASEGEPSEALVQTAAGGCSSLHGGYGFGDVPRVTRPLDGLSTTSSGFRGDFAADDGEDEPFDPGVCIMCDAASQARDGFCTACREERAQGHW